MKYQLLNGWTPEKLFARLSYWPEPRKFFTHHIPDRSPFSLEVCQDIWLFLFFSLNQHEALARWLVANTEGDW